MDIGIEIRDLDHCSFSVITLPAPEESPPVNDYRIALLSMILHYRN